MVERGKVIALAMGLSGGDDSSAIPTNMSSTFYTELSKINLPFASAIINFGWDVI